MTDDLADDVAAQAQELWSHLPADAVDDDAPLEFRIVDGRLQVRAGDTLYLLRDGAAWACRRSDGGVTVEAWRDGQLINRATGAEAALLSSTPEWN